MRRWETPLGPSGLVVGLATLGCHPEPPAIPPQVNQRLGSVSVVAAAPAASVHGLRGPRLLPLLDRIEPSYVHIEHPGTAELIVDGFRLVVRANGSFELALGILPVARSLKVIALPARLGSKVLFELSTPEDCWLMQADGFTGALASVGKLDVPIAAVTPGFEAIYATIASTGQVIAIDPIQGRAAEATLLPPAPEYGPVAIVDDWFGAYVDPLRGLMTSHDAGLHWRPAAESAASVERAPSRMLDTGSIVHGLYAGAGELVIDLGKEHLVGISRRGDLRHLDESEPPKSRPRSIHSWVQRWKMNELGGWPIELAVTRGALLDGDVAAVVSHGLLAQVRLRDGTIQSMDPVAIAPDRTCQALQAESEIYFHCQGFAATSLHRWSAAGGLERLGELVGQRDVVSVSSAGVMLRGACGARGGTPVGSFCRLRGSQAPDSIQLVQATGRERLVGLDAATIAVLSPPSRTRNGRIAYLGREHSEVSLVLPKDCSKQQRSILLDGFWLERPSLRQGAISTWVTLGDELLGVQIAATGEVTLGEVVSGASRAVISEHRVILPDGSGFARESIDGGLTYLRPYLPIPVASTLGAISRTSQRYGCSRVGCQLGDWLRVGWSAPGRTAKNAALEFVTSPDSLGVARHLRRVPRLRCEVEQGQVSPPRDPAEVPRTRTASGRSESTELLESTAFYPFYAASAPPLPASLVGFSRGWLDERIALHGYARAPLRSKKMNNWKVDIRIFDPLHRDSIWSVAGVGIEFESIEAAARAFADPRYGEDATNWSVVLDPDGDGALLSTNDGGKVRAFLLEPGAPILELSELVDRAPRRISDIARLSDGWYLLGTEPGPRLVVVSAGQSRVVSDFDPRSRLRAARLRMVKNRDNTRVGYLALSARLRAADVQWFVYPINAATGNIEQPIVVPLDRGIRACDADEDGWLFETSMDIVADVELTSTGQDLAGRTQGLLLLTEAGLCIDRLLFTGIAPRAGKTSLLRQREPSKIRGRHVDEAGRMRQVSCNIAESGAK